MTIIQWLDQLDKAAFKFVHVDMAIPSLDWLLLLLRKGEVWIPLYVFLLYWIIRYGKKYTWKFIVLTLVCFTLTDYLCVEVLKPFFGRMRPCNDPALASIIRGIINCAGKYSFPSAHASNHFGLAAFWFFSIRVINGQKWYWLWLWAFLVCFAQVYVGKHYPGDVLAGAVFGTLTGLLVFWLFKRWTWPGAKDNKNK